MYTSKEVLKSALVEKGFSSVKFPGGGGDERRHTSTVLMWNLIGDELVFVVLPHRHVDPALMKVVSEVHTKDETSYDTAVREVEEETGIHLDRNNLYKYFDYEFERKGQTMKKHFFIAKIDVSTIEEFGDQIRESLFEEDSGYPVVVTLGTLVKFLNDDKNNAGLYSKVSLRYAVEKIHQEIPESVGNKSYALIAHYPGKKDIRKIFKSFALC